MNIKDKIQKDLDKLHVSKEIELLRKALNIYMVRLNNYLVTVEVFGGKSFHAVFKFYAKSNSLSYWEHSVGSANAKEDILALIERIESQTKELLC